MIWLPPNIPVEPSEVWGKLPTGPDDEFWWASPIYYVSTLGRVYWYTEHAQPHRREGLKAQRLQRGPGNKKPHYVTNLHVAGGGKQGDRKVYVARLVLATHAGPEDAWKPLGRHGPGGSLDNRLANLVRGTYSENMKDQYVFGERRKENDVEEGESGVVYVPDPALGF